MNESWSDLTHGKNVNLEHVKRVFKCFLDYWSVSKSDSSNQDHLIKKRAIGVHFLHLVSNTLEKIKVVEVNKELISDLVKIGNWNQATISNKSHDFKFLSKELKRLRPHKRDKKAFLQLSIEEIKENLVDKITLEEIKAVKKLLMQNGIELQAKKQIEEQEALLSN